MNKLELIDEFRLKASLPKHDASYIVQLFFDEMGHALARGERVEIRGFCSFFVKKYKAYYGQNPKTKEKVRIKAKKLPFFRCGKDLRDRVDY